MKWPPQWAREVWKRSNINHGQLRFCGTESDAVKKATKDVEKQFDNIDWLRPKLYRWNPREGGPDSPAALILCVAWALYVEDWNGVLTDETKFAFAGFLKAGSGHVMTAYDLVQHGKPADWHRYKQVGQGAVFFLGEQYGLV